MRRARRRNTSSRPIDRSKRSNHRCLNCTHFCYVDGTIGKTCCELTGDPKTFYNSCAKLEWDPELIYTEPLEQEPEIVEECSYEVDDFYDTDPYTAAVSTSLQKSTAVAVGAFILGITSIVAAVVLKRRSA